MGECYQHSHSFPSSRRVRVGGLILLLQCLQSRLNMTSTTLGFLIMYDVLMIIHNYNASSLIDCNHYTATYLYFLALYRFVSSRKDSVYNVFLTFSLTWHNRQWIYVLIIISKEIVHIGRILNSEREIGKGRLREILEREREKLIHTLLYTAVNRGQSAN